MKTILAPLDFSSATGAVVEEAVALARAQSGRVVLLAIIQPPVIAQEYAAVIENLDEITAASAEQAARQLAEIERTLQAERLATACVQLVGSPIALIVEQAKKFDADYIVMGSHGHTALYDLLVGSTTHGVLMRAPCPVVIIPAAKNGKSRKALKAPEAMV